MKNLILFVPILFLLGGCLEDYSSQVELAADTSLAASQFESVGGFIHDRRDLFSDVEWAKLEAAEKDFDDAVDHIKNFGVFSVAQVKALHASLKEIYKAVHVIIAPKLSDFKPHQAAALTAFHERMVRIDTAVAKLEESASYADKKQTLNMIGAALAVGVKIVKDLDDD